MQSILLPDYLFNQLMVNSVCVKRGQRYVTMGPLTFETTTAQGRRQEVVEVVEIRYMRVGDVADMTTRESLEANYPGIESDEIITIIVFEL